MSWPKPRWLFRYIPSWVFDVDWTAEPTISLKGGRMLFLAVLGIGYRFPALWYSSRWYWWKPFCGWRVILWKWVVRRWRRLEDDL